MVAPGRYVLGRGYGQASLWAALLVLIWTGHGFGDGEGVHGRGGRGEGSGKVRPWLLRG